MILCAPITSRSHESRARNVCLFYSQNNKSIWLSNMADNILRNSRGAQRCMGFFLDCIFRVLIGWAGKLRSRGLYYNYQIAFRHNLCNVYLCRARAIVHERNRLFSYHWKKFIPIIICIIVFHANVTVHWFVNLCFLNYSLLLALWFPKCGSYMTSSKNNNNSYNWLTI